MTVEADFEQAVLAADLAGLEALDDEQWDTVADLAVAEGLGGLLYWRCKRAVVELPSKVQSRLRAEYWARATDNFTALQHLGVVLDEFGCREIEVVVLPGAPLLSLYPDPGCRPMDDIDVLVRPQQAVIAAAALAERGLSRRTDMMVSI